MDLLLKRQQTQSCRSLLASIVLLSITDACVEPTKRVRLVPGTEDRFTNITSEAWTAMRFLFDPTVSGLSEVAEWIDMDPVYVQRSIMKAMDNRSELTIKNISPRQRENFRRNYKAWLACRDFNLEEEHD